jgi:hypothetical protein
MLSVYPSGAARATRPTPRLPAAPATFSTITGWPSDVFMRSAMIRANTSTGPPGANGTTRVTGRVGNVCACAPDTLRTATAAIAESHFRIHSSRCDGPLLSGLCSSCDFTLQPSAFPSPPLHRFRPPS